MKAILPVAGVGWRLKPLSDARPKCLLEVGGRTILERTMRALASCGVQEAVLIVGHLREQIMDHAGRNLGGVRIRYVENPHFKRGNILSLWHAREEFNDDLLLMDGDVLFHPDLLRRLIADRAESGIVVDPGFEDTGEEMKVVAEAGRALDVSKKITDEPRVAGEHIGIIKLSASDAGRFRAILEGFIATGGDSLEYEEALRKLMQQTVLRVVETGGLPWVEIDFPEDLERARREILPRLEVPPSG